MSKRHNPATMTATEPFEWRSGTRKTTGYYVDFYCPDPGCRAHARRIYARSRDGVMCDGIKQIAIQRWRQPTQAEGQGQPEEGRSKGG